jgi:hypothetical protein
MVKVIIKVVKYLAIAAIVTSLFTMVIYFVLGGILCFSLSYSTSIKVESAVYLILFIVGVVWFFISIGVIVGGVASPIEEGRFVTALLVLAFYLAVHSYLLHILVWKLYGLNLLNTAGGRGGDSSVFWNIPHLIYFRRIPNPPQEVDRIARRWGSWSTKKLTEREWSFILMGRPNTTSAIIRLLFREIKLLMEGKEEWWKLLEVKELGGRSGMVGGPFV